MKLALVLLLAAAPPEAPSGPEARHAPEAARPEAPPEVARPEAPTAVAEGAGVQVENLDAALDDLFVRAREAVRVAVLPVTDEDEERARALQAALVRAVLERGREEVITPSMVKAVISEAAEAALSGGEYGAFRALSADHLLLSEVADAGGEVRLRLRLVHVESGAVRAEAAPRLLARAAATSVKAPSARAALERLADDLLLAVEQLPGDIRYQRVAVAPLAAEGEAVQRARVGRFVQAELGRLLEDRGFLVVERARLDEAFAQMSLGESLDEEAVPKVGKLLDAQALVLGSVGDAGDRFVVSCRAVSAETGQVLGVARVFVPRDGVVSLASDALETRTPEEALFRSLVAPGWGQFYNEQPLKGLVFAGAGYGGALLTLGLGVGAGVSYGLYTGYRPDEGTPPLEAAETAKGLREQTNLLVGATAVSAALTALVWGAGGADAFLDGLSRE